MKTPSPSKRCPVCAKAVSPRFKPFCSGKCADVDLHRWLSGAYVIPSEPSDEDETPVLPEEFA